MKSASHLHQISVRNASDCKVIRLELPDDMMQKRKPYLRNDTTREFVLSDILSILLNKYKGFFLAFALP